MRAERTIQLAKTGPVARAAVISECGRYRYQLLRGWEGGSGALTFVMLNPSTADAELDDPTVRRCMGFARSAGYGGVCVVNLFALRTTNPSTLRTRPWPVGQLNNHYLCLAFQTARSRREPVVAAWGPAPSVRTLVAERAADVVALARGCRVELMCLGQSKSGAPRHPLMLPATATLRPWGGAHVS
jgi:hypothetical protein